MQQALRRFLLWAIDQRLGLEGPVHDLTALDPGGLIDRYNDDPSIPKGRDFRAMKRTAYMRLFSTHLSTYYATTDCRTAGGDLHDAVVDHHLDDRIDLGDEARDRTGVGGQTIAW